MCLFPHYSYKPVSDQYNDDNRCVAEMPSEDLLKASQYKSYYSQISEKGTADMTQILKMKTRITFEIAGNVW